MESDHKAEVDRIQIEEIPLKYLPWDGQFAINPEDIDERNRLIAQIDDPVYGFQAELTLSREYFPDLYTYVIEMDKISPEMAKAILIGHIGNRLRIDYRQKLIRALFDQRYSLERRRENLQKLFRTFLFRNILPFGPQEFKKLRSKNSNRQLLDRYAYLYGESISYGKYSYHELNQKFANLLFIIAQLLLFVWMTPLDVYFLPTVIFAIGLFAYNWYQCVESPRRYLKLLLNGFGIDLSDN